MFSPTTIENSSLCPSCGSQIGQERKRCIYCGAGRDQRIATSYFQYYGMFLLVVALFYLILAVSQQPDYHPIYLLNTDMNFKRVRIKGLVQDVKIYRAKYKEQSLVHITLSELECPAEAQSRRSIRLKAEGKVGATLIDNKLVPNIGDIISVSPVFTPGKTIAF